MPSQKTHRTDYSNSLGLKSDGLLARGHYRESKGSINAQFMG